MTLRKPGRRVSQHSEDGYVLLMLLLTVSVMIVFTAAVVPSIAFEIKRDREEEMIRRGVQYSRAIRLYYLKFGRYPTKLEDLESTKNMRFLRKRYKDPLAGRDFKLLHFSDLHLSPSEGGIPGASPIESAGSADESGTPDNALNNGGFGPASKSGNPRSLGENSAFGENGQIGEQVPDSASSQPSSPDPQSSRPGSANGQSDPGDQLAPIFGGSVVGVVSASKAVGIREFDHKRKYSEWQFAFDPTSGVGLPTGPNQRPWQFLPRPLTSSGATGTVGTSSGGPQSGGPQSAVGTSPSNESGNPP